MSKPYDATPKALIEMRPSEWAAFVGASANRVEVMDADVSTVTAATDKVLKLHTSEGEYIQHYDFQSGPDASVPCRVHGYNGLLDDRHNMPVESIVVLLHPKANLKAISGVYQRYLPGQRKPYLTFRYKVIKVWQLPVDEVLRAGLSILPLAPISAVKKEELPGVIAQMKQRLDAETDQNLVGELWTATKVLLGLKYDSGFIEGLLQGVRSMKESSTYQAIVAEGEAKGLTMGERNIILRLGEKKFGAAPSAAMRRQLEAITDVGELERLGERLLDVDSWADLLAVTPAKPSKPPGRKKSS